MLRRIQITNMGPFASFDSGELPAVALIEGGNGVGKTGLMDCIRWTGDSGHDPDMIHGASEFGEVIITTDDDTQLRVRTSRDQTVRYWKPKDGQRWLKGREEIDKIYKAIGYDPLKFLALPEKQQIEKLAEISDAKATPEEITAAVGEATEEASGAKLQPGMNGLDYINAIHSAIYDARRTLNVGADTQEKHAAELERALPPPAPEGEDWSAAAARLQREKEALEATERAGIAELGSEFAAAKDAAQQALRTACEEIDADINAKITALERERATRKGAASKKSAEKVEYARGIASTEAGKIKAANKPKLDALAADLATAQERSRAQQQAEGTRKAVEVARQEAAAKSARAEVLTAALKRLEVLKQALVARMPIRGGRLEGGRIVRDQDGGLVPLKHWNEADQMTFAMQVGMKIGGGFVIMDGIQAYDGPHRKALIATCRRYAEQRGVQFILAAVDQAEAGPLRISGAE